MQHLIDDLMSLSRIEAERFNVPRDTVDLLHLVEEVRAGCAQLFIDRSNSWPSRITRRVDRPFTGDRGAALQLVSNLVVNALKYGRPESQVTVRFEDAGPDRICGSR